MMKTNNQDKALEAMMKTPAFDRTLDCISICYLLNSLACEYFEEANVLLERFNLEHTVANVAISKLDKAYDNYFDVMESLLDTEARKELNNSSSVLRDFIENSLNKN